MKIDVSPLVRAALLMREVPNNGGIEARCIPCAPAEAGTVIDVALEQGFTMIWLLARIVSEDEVVGWLTGPRRAYPRACLTVIEAQEEECAEA